MTDQGVVVGVCASLSALTEEEDKLWRISFGDMMKWDPSVDGRQIYLEDSNAMHRLDKESAEFHVYRAEMSLINFDRENPRPHAENGWEPSTKSIKEHAQKRAVVVRRIAEEKADLQKILMLDAHNLELVQAKRAQKLLDIIGLEVFVNGKRGKTLVADGFQLSSVTKFGGVVPVLKDDEKRFTFNHFGDVVIWKHVGSQS